MNTIQKLQAQVGADIVKTGGEVDAERHLHDFAIKAPASAKILAAAYPRTTADVAKILRICNEDGLTVVPQGGLTGLAGGGVPISPCLALSLERMRTIEEVDSAAATMTVQAGVPLEKVQNAADDAGFFFPLDLGGRGSAQIGGNASTNAGGNRVLRYGMMRDLVLGIEAVLPDGTVLTSLNKMLKNNAGYDLKQLFIGTEGTLGVITRLVVKLFPKPKSVCTALCALADYDQVVKLLQHARAGLGGDLAAYEVMWPYFYHLGTVALSRRPPIAPDHGVYVLMETLGLNPATDLPHFESVIFQAIESGIVADAVIAKSKAESQALWSIRDCPGEFPRMHWPQLSFDVSIPTGQIGIFRERCEKQLKARWPDLTVAYFGHVADSNLHLSIRLDDKAGTEQQMDEVVYEVVGEWRGSVSAEHGIGIHKRPYLHYSRTPEEIASMQLLKRALDPKGILNPGKVF